MRMNDGNIILVFIVIYCNYNNVSFFSQRNACSMPQTKDNTSCTNQVEYIIIDRHILKIITVSRSVHNVFLYYHYTLKQTLRRVKKYLSIPDLLDTLFVLVELR